MDQELKKVVWIGPKVADGITVTKNDGTEVDIIPGQIYKDTGEDEENTIFTIQGFKKDVDNLNNSDNVDVEKLPTEIITDNLNEVRMDYFLFVLSNYELISVKLDENQFYIAEGNIPLGSYNLLNNNKKGKSEINNGKVFETMEQGTLYNGINPKDDHTLRINVEIQGVGGIIYYINPFLRKDVLKPYDNVNSVKLTWEDYEKKKVEAAAEAERLKEEKAKAERLAAKQAELDILVTEREERERLEKERLEQERLKADAAKQKEEEEAAAVVEKERLAEEAKQKRLAEELELAEEQKTQKTRVSIFVSHNKKLNCLFKELLETNEETEKDPETEAELAAELEGLEEAEEEAEGGGIQDGGVFGESN